MATDIEQRIEEIRTRNAWYRTTLAGETDDGADAIDWLCEQLASVPSQVEAAVKAEREAWGNVVLVGAQLSNIAYNLSHAGKDRVITEHERKVLGICASDWDAAIRSRGETSL
ncbi:MAG TPA: hypothetical protein VN602_02190 [Gemmatimonadaceae bacterium]|nr:hypothetical protein [Gemmatimonadaceae bacterium]